MSSNKTDCQQFIAKVFRNDESNQGRYEMHNSLEIKSPKEKYSWEGKSSAEEHEGSDRSFWENAVRETVCRGKLSH